MIGILDSGSGGLTVLRALRALASESDVAYFGDIANSPYGLKNKSELEYLTAQGIRTLKKMGATEIVAACNSVSSAVLDASDVGVPIIEMSHPTAHFLKKHKADSLLLLATPATVALRLYDRALAGSSISLVSCPMAELASAIEMGRPASEIERIVRSALLPLRTLQFRGVVLGCTHYPLVGDIIGRAVWEMFGRVCEIIDPGEAVAHEAAVRFDTHGSGRLVFRISRDSRPFRKRVAEFFGDMQEIEIGT